MSLKKVFVVLVCFFSASQSFCQLYNKKDIHFIHEKATELIEGYVENFNLLGNSSLPLPEREYYRSSFIELFRNKSVFVFNDLDPDHETSQELNIERYSDYLLQWYHNEIGIKAEIDKNKLSYDEPSSKNGHLYVDIHLSKKISGLFMGNKYQRTTYQLKFRISFKKTGIAFLEFKIAGIRSIAKIPSATLTVRSTPPGVKVYIAGSYEGKTPIDISLRPGTIRVKLTKQCCTTIEGTVNLSSSGTTVNETLDCGENSFTDTRDNKTYKTVRIGNQVWMAENLAYKTNSGCWAYDDDESYVPKYGYLYNWKTAKNVCPSGWRLPTKADFETLLDNFGGEGEKAYTALIKGGSSGFSAPFGGFRCSFGKFYLKGYYANFWSSSEDLSDHGWKLYIYSRYKKALMSRYNESWGFSVRCLQDN